MKKIKGALKSKTMWFNAAMAVLSLLETNLELLKPVLGESAFGVISFATIVGNGILRWITTQSLEGKLDAK